jgi:hypothetical protein
MKIRLLILSLLWLSHAGAEPVQATIQDMAWMAGIWSNSMGGEQTVEVWSLPERGVMKGHGANIRDGRTLFWESLNMVEENGSVTYVPFPDGRANSVTFALTKQAPGLLVFENPDHDFPQLIQYRLIAPDHLAIHLTGSGRVLDYELFRQCRWQTHQGRAVCTGKPGQ